MRIVATCRECSARFRVDDRAAGRRLKCRRCGASIRVPSRPVTADTPAQKSAAGNPAGRNEAPRKGRRSSAERLPPRRKPSSGRSKRKASDKPIDQGSQMGWLHLDRPYLWIAAPVVCLLAVVLTSLLHETAGAAVYLTLTIVTVFLVVGSVLLLLGRAFHDSVVHAMLSLFVPLYLFYWIGTEWYQARRPAQFLGLALLCHSIIGGINIALLLCVLLPVYGLLTGAAAVLLILTH